MNIGDQLPAVEFQATSGINTTFEHYRNKWLIIYFYPKDATPGCTTEGCNFRDHEKEFSRQNAKILGISRDSLPSHEVFKAKQNFPFELISDSDETLCKLFDVIKMKTMYGKETRGIERSTFLINPSGVIQHIWRKVNVKSHADEVRAKLTELQHKGS